LIFSEERPAVLLLTLEPDSVFDDTDRLLGIAVAMLESVTELLLLLVLLLSSDLEQAAKTGTIPRINTKSLNLMFPLKVRFTICTASSHINHEK
jgi:hypothetical protein